MNIAASIRVSEGAATLVLVLSIIGCFSVDSTPSTASKPKDSSRQPLEEPPEKQSDEMELSDDNAGNSTVQDGRAKPREEAEALKREAILAAQQVAQRYPQEPTSHLLLAAAHYNLGGSSEAIQHLERCLRLDPRRAEAYSTLAMIAWQRGDAQACAEYCRQALAINPKMTDVYHRLGQALLESGQTDKLIDVMKRAVKIQPRSSQSFYLLGQGYLQSRAYQDAKQAFMKVTAIRPDHTQAYFGLFTACARLGQQDQAKEYQQRFMELEAADRKALRDNERDPVTGLARVNQSTARTLTGAGQVSAAHGDIDSAVRFCQRAASLDPENVAARSGLVALYRARNQVDDAVAYFQQLAKAQPENTLNYYFVGNLHADLGQPDDAINAYRRMTEVKPKEPNGFVALAEYYLKSGRNGDEARRLAETAVQLEPVAENYFLSARACLSAGDRAGSLAAVQKALDLVPNHPRYRKFQTNLSKGR